MTIRQSVPREMPHVLDFDGVDDFVDFATPIETDILSVSISAKIYATGLDGLTSLAGQITNSFETGAVRRGAYLFGINGDGEFQTRYYPSASSASVQRVFSPKVQLNRWYSVTFTNDGGLGRLYVDGILVSENGEMTSMWSNEIQRINRVKGGQSDYSFLGGRMTDIAIHNRPLTSSEISNIHLHNILPTAGLVGRWNRLSDDGTQLLDTVGGNHGTIDGATRVTNLFGIPTPRKSIVPYVGALSFDGVDDFVQIENSANEVSDFQTGDTWDILFKTTALQGGTTYVFSLPLTSNRRYFLLSPTSNLLSVRTVNSSSTSTGKTARVGEYLRATLVTDPTTSTFRGYVNGILCATGSIDAPGSSTNINIGTRTPSDGFSNVNVLSARIYNRVLTTREVEDLYLYNTTPYDNDRAICKLNLETTAGQIVGDTWLDKSGNNNHGTITGAVLV